MKWECELGHIYEMRIDVRCGQGQGCPYCANKQVLIGFNDLASKFPELAKEADGWDPQETIWSTNQKRRWKCPLGHTYNSIVSNKTRVGTGCPYCANQQVWPGFNDLATKFPELAEEVDGWEMTKYAAFSGKKVQWKCKDCDHRWKAPISTRTGENKSGCQVCAVSGFKPKKPAWFYLMERPGEQQLGITNELRSRMRTHRKNGWSEIEIAGPYDGYHVEETERRLKQWLKSNCSIVKGTRENWHTKDLEVHSLEELFKYSEIKPLWEGKGGEVDT